jgi:hypothetical protein
MAFKQFKRSQRFRIISGQACFYTTKKEIDAGVGDFTPFNISVRLALATLEIEQGGVPKTAGVSGVYNGYPIQINIVN